MEIFPSKIDSSYYAILGLYGFISLSFCIVAKSLGSFLFVALVFLLIFAMLRAIKYTIDEKSNRLIIFGGVFYNSTLNINSIVSIEKDKTFLASPAASFDGIRIKTMSKSVKISPRNQDKFLDSLKRLNPQITINI